MDDLALLNCPLSTWDGDPEHCRWCGDPLGPGRRRWCSDECGNRHMRNHIWNRARAYRLWRDRFACQECGTPASIRLGERAKVQVHHIEPILGKHARNGCHHHQEGLITLCSQRADGEQACHNRAHFGDRIPEARQLRLYIAA